jgi:hypothetical protein
MLCRDTTYVSTLLLLSMRTRTTFGAYRMTYVASPHNCWCVPLDLCLKVTAVHEYSIFTGIIRNVRYAPRNRCVTHSLCRGLLYYRTRRNTSYVTTVQTYVVP